jgi:hypothetical protein
MSLGLQRASNVARDETIGTGDENFHGVTSWISVRGNSGDNVGATSDAGGNMEATMIHALPLPALRHARVNPRSKRYGSSETSMPGLCLRHFQKTLK